MTQMGQGPYRQSGAQSNIFTVLVVIAFIVLAVGVGVVWYKHHQLFKTHPFNVVERPRILSVRIPLAAAGHVGGVGRRASDQSHGVRLGNIG